MADNDTLTISIKTAADTAGLTAVATAEKELAAATHEANQAGQAQQQQTVSLTGALNQQTISVGNLAKAKDAAAKSGNGLSVTIRTLGGAVNALGGSFAGIGSKIAGLFSPGGIVAAASLAVGALTAAIGGYFQRLSEARESAAEKQMEKLKQTVTDLATAYDTLTESIKAADDARRTQQTLADEETAAANETELQDIEARRQQELAGNTPDDEFANQRTNAKFDQERNQAQFRQKRAATQTEIDRKTDAAALSEDRAKAFVAQADELGPQINPLQKTVEDNKAKMAKNDKMLNGKANGVAEGGHWHKKMTKENETLKAENERIKPKLEKLLKQREALESQGAAETQNAQILRSSAEISKKKLTSIGLAEASDTQASAAKSAAIDRAEAKKADDEQRRKDEIERQRKKHDDAIARIQTEKDAYLENRQTRTDEHQTAKERVSTANDRLAAIKKQQGHKALSPQEKARLTAATHERDAAAADYAPIEKLFTQFTQADAGAMKAFEKGLEAAIRQKKEWETTLAAKSATLSSDHQATP